MTPDAHTPCPACPRPVRDLYAVGRRVIAFGQGEPEVLAELGAALEALRPWYEAHHANQDHGFSPELEAARNPMIDLDLRESRPGAGSPSRYREGQ